MCEKKILSKFVEKPETETITGILKKNQTLDGKPLFKRRR